MHCRPSCWVRGVPLASGFGTPLRGAHDRIPRSQRATLADRSTVPPVAHAAPAITTTSSAHRIAPTGCGLVLVAASWADGGVMLSPTAGVAPPVGVTPAGCPV